MVAEQHHRPGQYQPGRDVLRVPGQYRGHQRRRVRRPADADVADLADLIRHTGD